VKHCIYFSVFIFLSLFMRSSDFGGAGADMVNDVSAGVYDALMVPTVGALGVPFIAMHMRGDPQTMKEPQYLSYRTAEADAENATDLVLQEQVVTVVVARELQERLAEIDRHIPRWLQLVDPGIGFAKGYDENLSLLKPQHLRLFKQMMGDRWMVVGFSRKKFLSRIMEDSALQRSQLQHEIDSDPVPVQSPREAASQVPASLEELDLASAAGCCAAMMGQADILRVHNVAYSRICCDTFQAFSK
jgi:dihydropteroate synthase